MSKRKNVHPDHYKTGGSGHQGEDIVQREHRKKLTREQAELEKWQKPEPGTAEAPSEDEGDQQEG